VKYARQRIQEIDRQLKEIRNAGVQETPAAAAQLAWRHTRLLKERGLQVKLADDIRKLQEKAISEIGEIWKGGMRS
jgi:hypothetical protein